VKTRKLAFTELSPVQQQLTEINNRYGLLGVRLSDRQAELDSIREEVKKHLDNLRSLGQFLDKVQRNLPKETVPHTKEDADKIAKQMKTIVEDMYEKQSLLDSTRSQVNDLLRRKPGALGADSLHDELTDVVSRWKSLHDRCKDRYVLVLLLSGRCALCTTLLRNSARMFCYEVVYPLKIFL
jgi:predicted transcriptional regulator